MLNSFEYDPENQLSNDVKISQDDLGAAGIRLYICDDCKQIIPIHSDGTPPYKYDYLLHTLEDQHGFRGHRFAVVTVNKAGWEDTQGQKKIVQAIKDSLAGGETGFGSAFYDVKDQFREDAMECWRQHNRTHNCQDFKSEKKVLQPDTKDLRRSEGLGDYRSNIHLCNFCPVASLVEQALRKKALKG